MSDPNGQLPPVHVLTSLEAAERLRLTEDYKEAADAVRALHRLVRLGKLKPLRCGKSYKFLDVELDRYAVVETDAFMPKRSDPGEKEP